MLPANARALLEPALDANQSFTWADVEARLDANTAQLWMGVGCALVTEIIGDCLHCWLGGGSLRGLMAMREPIEETARFWGLKRASIIGRKGWDRIYSACGYRRVGEELEKTL